MENTKVICPSCNNEITDITAFTRANYTCPHCKTFLKNNRDILKACAPQANKKASAVASKNFMGINITSEPTMPKAAKQANTKGKETEEHPKVEKTFNNAPRSEKQFKAPAKENLGLFDDVDDSSSTLSPELEALYDDDDYITVPDESQFNNNSSVPKDDDYYEPEDDEDEDSFWDDDDEEDSSDDQAVFTLAQIDDDEEDGFSDADIINTNHAQYENEVEEFEEREKIIQAEQEPEPVAQEIPNNTDSKQHLTENELKKAPANPNLDLFDDLNAVADAPTTPVKANTGKAENKPVPAVPIEESINPVKSKGEIEDDYYVSEEDEDYDDYDSSDEEENLDDGLDEDEILEDEVDQDEEEQVSLAVKLLRKAKAKKKNKSTLIDEKTDDEDSNEIVNTIDINDDIGRRVKKSVFNSNKDHYYDDGKPFVDPEPDTLQPKTFLKVVGIFGLLILFTAYFIYMMP